MFPADRVITPAQVRGDFATLPEAVEAGRWLTLAQARGKVLFALDDGARSAACTASCIPTSPTG